MPPDQDPGTPAPPPPALASPLLPELPPASAAAGPGPTASGEFTPPKGLPVTGAEALPLVTLGLAAIAAGGAAMAASRRRASRES